MKKIIALCFGLFVFFNSQAQEKVPVSWSASYKAISATEGEIIISATLEKDWHTYSQRPTDAGPIPTSFNFEPGKQFTLIGKTEESDAHEEYVEAFGAKIFLFTSKAQFKQKIKINSKEPFSVAFRIEFMCCNNTMCLPPKQLDLKVKVQ